MKTLSELNTSIRTEMQLDPGLVSDAERTRFINEAIDDLSAIGLWEKDAVIDVTAGTYEVSLPVDFINLTDVFWDDKLRLKAVQRVAAPGSVEGTPIGYILNPGVLELYPKPGQNGKLYVGYTYAGVNLVNADDTPNFHIDVSNAIIDYGVGMAHRKNGNIGMYREYMSSYTAKKAVVIDRLTREQSTRVRVINSADFQTGLPYTPFDYLD